MAKSNSLKLFNILSIVGLVIWALCFFFGINFTNNGAWVVSMLLALFLLGVTYLLVRAMRKASKENDSKSRTTRIIALVLYCLSMVVSAIYVVHFLDITINHQNEIQDEAMAEINEIVDYLDCDPESPNPQSYMAWVNQELDSYRRHLRAKDVSESTIETKVEELKSQLVDESGFSSMVSEAEDFLGYCKYSVMNWQWTTIPKYLAQLSEKKPQYEQSLEEFALSTDFTKADSNPYKCASLHNDPTMAQRISSPSLASWTILPILCVLVLQVLILLIYFIEKPSSGSMPSRYKDDWGSSYDPNKKPGTNSEFSNNFPAEHYNHSQNHNGGYSGNNAGSNSANNNNSNQNKDPEETEITLM